MVEEEIDSSVINSTKDLFEKGYYEEEIEDKLKKMKYSDEQIKAIFEEAQRLIADKGQKLKRMQFAAIILSFIIFILGVALIAIIQAS
jgi:methylphosphotriester-DNA--protein-cysteine methyltransferase